MRNLCIIRHPFLTLTAAITVAGITTGVPLVLHAQEDADPSAETAVEETATDDDSSLPAPETILDSVLQVVTSATSIQADLAETVSIGYRQFRATGRYEQGGKDQLRLTYDIHFEDPGDDAQDEEVDLDVASLLSDFDDEDSDATGTSLLQVSDGQVLWTMFSYETERYITRSDLQTIREALQGYPAPVSANFVDGMGLGGLRGLLESLQASMEFRRVRRETVDGRDMIVVVGAWNERTQQVLRGDSEPGAPLPGHAPDYVRLYLDKATLFPRRLMYLKRHPVENKIRPILTLDFLNVVLNGPVDDNNFRFTPPDGIKLTDVTDQVIQRFRETRGQAGEKGRE